MQIKNIIIAIMFILGIGKSCITYAENASMYLPPTYQQGDILFSESRRQVNAVNPTPYSNPIGRSFPGARGANQLIIYTPSYGERTGTNEFGTEAIIEGNTVVELSGADSFIPENGAVISGHGLAKNWISANMTIGTKVYFDEINNVITTYTTSRSYMFEAMQKIDEANAMIDYYKTSNPAYDWSIPTDYVKEAQNYIRKGEKNPNQMKKYSQLAIESANSAIKSVLPFKTNEFKGVWLRPTETTTAEIIESVRRIKTAGIDNIFIETYFHGRTIYPSKVMSDYGFVEQYEKFAGFDPLRVWISEAHKNGIKVHIWFETFYVGNNPPSLNPNNILAVKPEWGNKTLNGSNSYGATPSVSEHNGYFLDPSNIEVQEFLAKLLWEIITTYKPDGINLDYIRYPQAISSSPSGNWGYTANARSLFNQQYGVDPATLKTTDPLWMSWNNFRRSQINGFVKKIGDMTKEKGVYLSAVIFPDKSVAYTRKLQDWGTWSQNHYLQGFTPLFLTCDQKTFNSQVKTVLNYKAPETDLFAGLFVTFMGGSEEDLIRQIHESRKLDVNGVILFDFAHLDNKYINALSTRVFSADATGKDVKKNVFQYQQENQKPINNKTSIQQLLNSPEYLELKKEQNKKFIIKKYDPGKIAAPTPALTPQKKRW